MSNNELNQPLGCAFPVVMDPEYSEFLTKARIIGKQEGYAIALHGSMTRDFDVVAIPWTSSCHDAFNLVMRLCLNTGWKDQDGDPVERDHGRLVWSLIREEFGDPRFIDLSVMPRKPKQNIKISERYLGRCKSCGKFKERDGHDSCSGCVDGRAE
ncbi:MAG: hypothetical protein AAF546_00150 [Verrucomicrobiota bacterium]